MTVKLLKLPAVLKRVTNSSTRMSAQIKEGIFPVPISFGARAIEWVEEEVEDWFLARVEAARTGASHPKQKAVA